MRLWVLCLCATSAIAIGAIDEVHIPVELLVGAAKSPTAKLKPLMGNAVKPSRDTDGVTRRDNPLAGLLERQSCPQGFGECSNTATCCPLGGRCCSDGGCCAAGSWCFGNGCCLLSEDGCDGNSCCPHGSNCCSGGGCCGAGDYCAIADGRLGCCPFGEVCSGSGTSGCSLTGYSPCPGEDFCCPTGQQCFRDGAGQPSCGSKSGTGNTATRPAPTPTPPITTNTHRDSSSTSTTRSPNTTTVTSRIKSTAVIPSPTVPVGSSTTVIEFGADDPRFAYKGSWQSKSSSCNSSAQSRMAADSFSSFSIDFQGSAVYLSVATNNVWYTVTVGGETTDFGLSNSTVVPSNCTFSFAQTGLSSNLHTMVVFVYGVPLSSSSDAPWSFEFNKLVVTTGNGPVVSSSHTVGAAQPTTTNAAPLAFSPLKTLAYVAVVMTGILILL